MNAKRPPPLPGPHIYMYICQPNWGPQRMRQGTLTGSIINQVSMRDLLIPVYVSFICGGGGGGAVEGHV